MPSDLNEAALLEWLIANIEGFSGPLRIEKFPGGQSNPTYKIQTPSGAYVLRRKPFGNLLPSAHAVDREFRLLSALHPAGFPTPRPIVLCEDAAVIGADFYIMELVEGRIFRETSMPGLAPAERSAHFDELIRTLARLHSVDYAAAGLSDFVRPGNYFARQVARWSKQYRASQTDDIAAVEKVMDFLARTIPPQQGDAIIHGDYRVDNVIFESERPKIAAVIDWELTTIGDPLADLAYLLMSWVMPPEGPSSLAGIDFAATGIPALNAAVEHYCRASGRQAVPNLSWYFAYNLFRLTGIIQGVKKRMLDGNASGANANEVAAQIPILAEAAWAQAQLAGAS